MGFAGFVSLCHGSCSFAVVPSKQCPRDAVQAEFGLVADFRDRQRGSRDAGHAASGRSSLGFLCLKIIGQSGPVSGGWAGFLAADGGGVGSSLHSR